MGKCPPIEDLLCKEEKKLGTAARQTAVEPVIQLGLQPRLLNEQIA